MDIVARYNIQRGKPITLLHQTAADYSYNGDPIDTLILQRKEMFEKFQEQKDYDAFVKQSANDIYKELVKMFNQIK